MHVEYNCTCFEWTLLYMQLNFAIIQPSAINFCKTSLRWLISFPAGNVSFFRIFSYSLCSFISKLSKRWLFLVFKIFFPTHLELMQSHPYYFECLQKSIKLQYWTLIRWTYYFIIQSVYVNQGLPIIWLSLCIHSVSWNFHNPVMHMSRSS